MADAAPEQLHLRLDGFEGPLDLLLDLARAKKLDLAAISISALVDQYLATVAEARRLRLELAADWLVMAAWLTWLKSRLLIPPDPAEPEEALNSAEALAARLRALSEMQAAAAFLEGRPRFGRDVFARGAPEDFSHLDRSGLRADLPGLLRGYVTALRRRAALGAYRPTPPSLWTVQEALGRLRAMLGRVPGWTELAAFLPDASPDPVERRAAVASTLVAGLELAKDGQAILLQEAPFSPILLREAPHG